jgi:hypothetical protein
MEYGVYLTPYSVSDPTRHYREWKWVRMRPPFPHPMTAEGQRMDLVVIRPTLSLLGGGGGERGRVTGREGGREKAESPSATGMWPTAESEAR